jgi:hypothetical protein
MQVGQRVPRETVARQHAVCHPATVSNTSLAEFDYSANGGVRKVTVIAHYYSGCSPGRDDGPLFNLLAELYLAQVRVCPPAALQDAKVANRHVRVWHGATEMVLERWTNPKPRRRTCSLRYGVPSCRGKSAGVAKR